MSSRKRVVGEVFFPRRVSRIFFLQIRASRLEQIDKELLSAQDRVQQTEPQVYKQNLSPWGG